METIKILNADVLDIIFDGRNKNYGAYDLRRTYNARVKKALAITGSITLLFFFGSVFANFTGSKKTASFEVVDTELTKLQETPPPVTPPPPVPPPPAVDVNKIKFNTPLITKDENVKPEDQLNEIQDDQVISSETKLSDNINPIVQAPVDEPNTSAIQVLDKKDDENQVFIKVEKEASFDGDWNNFLKKNLDASMPVNNDAPEGTYSVVVKFIVSKDGSLSDIMCESDPGYGICKEAMRVIKKSKKWNPAFQNGNIVNAYRRQLITFVVEPPQ